MCGNRHPLRGGKKERDYGKERKGLDLFWEQVARVRDGLKTAERLSVVSVQWLGTRKTEDVWEPDTHKETRLPHANYLFGIGGALVGWESHLNSSLLWQVGFILKTVYDCCYTDQQRDSRPSPKLCHIPSDHSLGDPQLLKIPPERE